MATNDKITPPELYFNRRTLMRGGLIAAGMAATGLLYRKINGVDLVMTETPELQGLVKPPNAAQQGYAVTDETVTSRQSILNYNNFYEFTTNKDGVAGAAEGFKTAGWKIQVGGLCRS
jgi:sulfoxide reductase catalytic subunit YedY